MNEWTTEEVYTFVKEHFSEETAEKFKGRCCQTCEIKSRNTAR